jgi:hypothetical protein
LTLIDLARYLLCNRRSLSPERHMEGANMAAKKKKKATKKKTAKKKK